jgi:dTDP-glucose 4,6-dehydratase
VSMAEGAAHLHRLAGGAAPRTEDAPSPRTEPVNWVADVDKTRNELGWFPQVDLEEGLARTVSWMREHPEFR